MNLDDGDTKVLSGVFGSSLGFGLLSSRLGLLNHMKKKVFTRGIARRSITHLH